jgi:hypothetical protein
MEPFPLFVVLPSNKIAKCGQEKKEDPPFRNSVLNSSLPTCRWISLRGFSELCETYGKTSGIRLRFQVRETAGFGSFLAR